MTKMTYSKDLAALVKLFLDAEEWHYSFDADRGIFRFGLNIKSKIRKIRYAIDITKDEIIVYAVCPICADHEDADMSARMAEFICRANYGLKNGCFEYDFRDGETRYRSFIDCEGQIPSLEVVKNSIRCTAAMFERYGTGITEVIFGGSSAKEAIEKCEKFPAKEIRGLLSELRKDADGSEVADMLDRLAQKLGVTDDDTSEDDSDAAPQEEAADGVMEVKLDLFDNKEGE